MTRRRGRLRATKSSCRTLASESLGHDGTSCRQKATRLQGAFLYLSSLHVYLLTLHSGGSSSSATRTAVSLSGTAPPSTLGSNFSTFRLSTPHSTASSVVNSYEVWERLRALPSSRTLTSRQTPLTLTAPTALFSPSQHQFPRLPPRHLVPRQSCCTLSAPTASSSPSRFPVPPIAS